ncbi:hypothetical protein J2W46_005806 [Paraburkholderia strydomiana]|nr:hypothetical protein [Paraburkholderia strydomiana]
MAPMCGVAHHNHPRQCRGNAPRMSIGSTASHVSSVPTRATLALRWRIALPETRAI